MKRAEEMPNIQTTKDTRQSLDTKINSTAVDNAHATGDGAVKKTDEINSSDEKEQDSSMDTTPY